MLTDELKAYAEEVGSALLAKHLNQSVVISNRIKNKQSQDVKEGVMLSEEALADIREFAGKLANYLQSNKLPVKQRNQSKSVVLSKHRPIFNSKEMLSGGVWVSPHGDIFGVPLTHVRAVVEAPEKFGFSIEQIKSIFNKHNEGIGSEGDARDEIISLLISKGWVRIRYYPGEFFHVELSAFTQVYSNYLSSWASKVIAKDNSKRSFKVVICELRRGLETALTLEELQDCPDLFSNKQNNVKELIESATIQDLLDENDRDPNFTHRAEHLVATKAQGDSEITRCYASSVELRTKSEHFQENKTYYRQWVLFKDFWSIARDKKIKFEDSVDYAINFCDVTIRCSCPAQTFWGYSYMGDQLGYLYGIPREKRFPKRNNPNLKQSTCKHVHLALEHILKNKENIIKMFGCYYKRLEETPPDTMIAIPSSVVREKKEESLDDFLAGFDEDGNELPSHEIDEASEQDQVEIISSTDPATGVIEVDTKLAEGKLPPEEQFKYAGEEDKPVDEVTVENVADSVSEEEVEEIATQIDEADTFSSYTPLHSQRGYAIFNSPNSDGQGGGTRYQAFFDRLQVFASTVETQIRHTYPSAFVFVSMGNADLSSYKATLTIKFNGKDSTALVMVGHLNGSCTGRVFGEGFISLNSLKDLSMDLAKHISKKYLEVVGGNSNGSY